MQNDDWQASDISQQPDAHPPSGAHSRGPLRLWLERIGVGLIAAISLLLPVLVGLLFYLAVTDGLVINANDPLHEARLWMVQERRGATGIGLTVSSPAQSNGSTQCAYTRVAFLKWERGLRLERNADYCRCYETRAGQWVESSTPCSAGAQ
jgi:hypothetical protein